MQSPFRRHQSYQEEMEYVESIMEDVKWLGFDWEDRLFYASDYFENLHNFAIKLIKEGKAYVDDQDAEAIANQKEPPPARAWKVHTGIVQPKKTSIFLCA